MVLARPIKGGNCNYSFQMATKTLRRVLQDNALLDKCEKQGIHTCGDLLSRSDLELLHLLDLPYPLLKDVIRLVSEKVVPPCVTVCILSFDLVLILFLFS